MKSYPHSLSFSCVWIVAALSGGVSAPLFAAQTKGVPPPVAESQYDGVPVAAPQGAKVLLAGDDLSQWRQLYRPKKGAPIDETIRWKVTPDYIEVVRGKGFLETREPVVTTGHLHLE